MIWYVCQGKLAGHPYRKNNDFRPSKDFWRREDILFSSRILHTDKKTSNNENYRLQYIQKSDPENHLKISISSKPPSLSPERADIHLNDSANSFSQRMSTIHQLCLIEKEGKKPSKKEQKRGKALKIQMQKIRMRQRKRERDCNSRPNHTIMLFYPLCECVCLCFSTYSHSRLLRSLNIPAFRDAILFWVKKLQKTRERQNETKRKRRPH